MEPWRPALRPKQVLLVITHLCHPQVEDNVAVVLLSEIVWDQFRPSTGCFEPLLLHFSDYSKGRTAPTSPDLARRRHLSHSNPEVFAHPSCQTQPV